MHLYLNYQKDFFKINWKLPIFKNALINFYLILFSNDFLKKFINWHDLSIQLI